MTATVIDASVLVAALGIDSPHGHVIRELLRERQLAAPALIDLEVASALRRLSSIGLVSSDRAQQALTDLLDIPINRIMHTPFLARCWELRENLTVYDAAYVAMAEELGVPLLTADARLSRSPGIRCKVDLIKLDN